MKCWGTKSGQKIFQILGGRSNSFLFSHGDRYILIDTGRENKWNKLKRRLDKIQLNENSLSALILTHTHFDHAENAYRIKDNYKTNSPGHSIGSISIIIDNEIAIVGDAMFGIFRNSVFPPYAEQPEIMIRSWKKLLDTGCSLFIPGHGTAKSEELLQKEYEKYKNRYVLQ